MTTDQRRFSRRLLMARAGDATAAFDVGCAYANGFGVDAVGPKALRWLKLATRSRSRLVVHHAWLALGCLYLQGRAMGPDAAMAVRMFRRGAAAGSADCMCHLGYCFRRGDGVRVSRRGSLLWFRRGADFGSPQCQFEVGNEYLDRGAAGRAIYWYRRAARGKWPWAMRQLGICYREGQGVKRREQTARHWFR